MSPARYASIEIASDLAIGTCIVLLMVSLIPIH